jgi:hypothetical protein
MAQKTIPAEWSRRKTRYDPPALDEAIAAAQGLTDRIEDQIEIAAQLMGLPEEEVRGPILRTARARSERAPSPRSPGRRVQVVVVERRKPRTVLGRASS